MSKKSKEKFLSAKELNIIRGKVLVGKAMPSEMLAVFAHLDLLEERLDREAGDAFGTEGWRHGFGIPEA